MSETALQQYAKYLSYMNWTIGSMTDQQFVGTKRKGMGGIFLFCGILGLFFYLIPGLLILLIGYAARGTKTMIVTGADAQAWQIQQEQQKVQDQNAREQTDLKMQANKEARQKKVEELAGTPLQFLTF